MSEPKTGYEMMMDRRKKSLECDISELSRIADANKDRIHYLSQEAYKLGLKYAIREIEGTEMLFTKMQNEVQFANPIEAAREHRNQMNTLATLKAALVRRHEGKP